MSDSHDIFFLLRNLTTPFHPLLIYQITNGWQHGLLGEGAQITLRLGKDTGSRDRKEMSTGTWDPTQVCLFKIRVLPLLTDYL